MDSVTQAVLGAAVGEVVLGKKIGNKGALLGAIVGTIPDLDILLYPLLDPLQKISVHRGFSHSILFCLIGAFLFAYILSRIKWCREVSVSRLTGFTFLALFTHILLDAFTSYGTQLFLPFSDWRVSFDSINIIDPVYTVPLLVGLLMSMFSRHSDSNRRIYNYIGLSVSTVYLLFTLGIKQHMRSEFAMELEEQNIAYTDLLTVPVGMASLNWYGVARSSDSLYMGKFSDVKHNHVPFESFPINDTLLEGLDSKLVDRLRWFAQGFYTVAEHDGRIRVYNMQCDMQGVRRFGDYKAPTAFYFEIEKHEDGDYEMKTGMHPRPEG